MIVDAIVQATLGLITAIFGLLPDIPPLPDSFASLLTQLEMFVIDAITFVFELVSKPFVVVVAGLVMVLVLFNPIYHMAMFIYNKVRGA